MLSKAEYQRLGAKYSDRATIVARVDGAATKEVERNNVLSDEIVLCNYKYNKFKTAIYVRDASFNSGMDLASIGLSGAATLVGGGGGQILSGADTALKAAQGKISERWLASKTIPVLISKMDADRAAVLTDLTENMKKLYKDFSIEQGLKLIEDYNNSGNLINALNSLQADASNKQSQNEDNVKAAQKKPAMF